LKQQGALQKRFGELNDLKKTAINQGPKMKTIELIEKLNLKILAGETGLNRNITGGYVSDLLSDVIGNAKEGSVWITLQTHLNTVAVASLKELSAIIIVNGHMPSEETILKSSAENIPLLLSDLPAFELTGRIYELLKTK
jgi:serine kinase of HPr protein (carbohydrate metabolism regulator)